MALKISDLTNAVKITAASHQLAEKTRGIANRLEKGITEFKEDYRRLTKTATKGGDDGITGPDPIIEKYTHWKGDIRGFLVSFRHMIEVSTAVNGHLKSQSLSKLVEEISQTERQFDFPSSCLTNESISEHWLSLDRKRDDVLSRCCQKLLDEMEKLAVMRHESRGKGGGGGDQVFGQMSKGNALLLKVFDKFMNMVNELKIVNLSRDDINMAAHMESTERKCQKLTGENEEKEKTIEMLTRNLKLAQDELGGRKGFSSRTYLDIIETHEETIRVLQQNLSRLTQENHELIVEKGTLSDLLMTSRSLERNLKGAYEKDILQFFPIMEKQIQQAGREVAEVRSLRNEIGINSMKITKGEEEKLEIRKQLEEMKTVVRHVRNEMTILQQQLVKAEMERDKQFRMKSVVVAAKLHYENICKELEGKLGEKESECRHLQSVNESLAMEITEVDRRARSMESKAEEAKVSEEQALDNLSILKAEVIGYELLLKKAEKEISSLCTRAQFEEQERLLAACQAENKRLKKMLDAADKLLHPD